MGFYVIKCSFSQQECGNPTTCLDHLTATQSVFFVQAMFEFGVLSICGVVCLLFCGNILLCFMFDDRSILYKITDKIPMITLMLDGSVKG